MMEATRKRVSHRLNIIRGQINGLQKMIDDDIYCMDILTQSLAIQKSLSSFSKLMIQNHITEHITPMIASKNLDIQLKAVKELLEMYELHNRRG